MVADGYVNSKEDFEKWIRMATDNKINTQNSWDLALIDYFHDLSLLRDGDGINFQKASATLDGCVKIYSSRVDSAATETGRLISGLATKRSDEREKSVDSDSEDELHEMHPDAPQRQRKSKRNTKRDTLAEFEQLKAKKMDLELFVDPLFKKALADFDEGGSKSLLLNMLNVDSRGKIVFDTTESAQLQREQLSTDEDSMDVDDANALSLEIDETLNRAITSLGERHLSHVLSSSVKLCPSITELRSVVEQKTDSAGLLKGLETIQLPDTAPDYNVENYHTTYQDFDVSFGDQQGIEAGQEVSAQDNSKYPGNRTSIFFDDMEDEADDYGITMRMLFDENKSYVREAEEHEQYSTPITNIPDDELLAYFDENQRRNWAGPEHWKISNLKQTFNFRAVNAQQTELPNTQRSTTTAERQSREKYTIDFLSDEFPDESTIFNETIHYNITIPKNHWISKDKNVLPDDKNFKTKDFITLFTKEKLLNIRFQQVKTVDQAIDETLYAENAAIPQLNNPDFFNDHNDNDIGGDIDFGDDYGYDYADVPASQLPQSQLMAKSHGSQLPLNYSRVSKKVDVKLLKDNLWETLNVERTTMRSSSVQPPSSTTIVRVTDQAVAQPVQRESEEQLKFSNVVTGLGSKYDPNTKKDLSTSFCFICLLHLANENGFTITNTEDNSDLIINNFKQPVT